MENNILKLELREEEVQYLVQTLDRAQIPGANAEGHAILRKKIVSILQPEENKENKKEK